ncbi:MAG: homoserine dehydrogenase [Desulfobaccales bacterium]
MAGRINQRNDDVKVAIIGMGAMGKGLFYQSHITPGIDCVAIADIKMERAIAGAQWLNRDYRRADNLETVHETIRQGKLAVCEDGDLLARCSYVDALVESSNSLISGGQFAVTALEHRKHLILMNSEVDLIFGPYLLRLAQDNQVIYTSCDGDQHGVIKRLIDDLRLWGFELVMAGNIKGFLDRYTNPEKIIPEADKRNLDYKMATAYADGTKLCIEMALLANALNLSIHRPGMCGPRAQHVSEVFGLFDFDSLWQDRQPLVDYIVGAEPGGGVFAVGYCDNEYQQSMLSYYKMGPGPFYLFYRPYHLCHVEAMAGIIDAARNKRGLLQPTYGFRTNVYAYAKRNLHKGEKLDGIGGYDCYGLIENCGLEDDNPGLPLCLAEGLTLECDRRKDEKLYLNDLRYDKKRFDFVIFDKGMELSKRGERCNRHHSCLSGESGK